AETGDTDVEGTHGFLQGFREGAANRHHFTDGLHLRAEDAIRPGEFLEVPARDLDDDVIQRWLEAGRCHLCDIVRDFIECKADGYQRRDLGNREAGRLTRQRRRPRDTRVHLDDVDLAVFRADGVLYI